MFYFMDKEFREMYNFNLLSYNFSIQELDWYISGKISDIIKGEVEGLSQNMTADELDCKNKINVVADTCFECSR